MKRITSVIVCMLLFGLSVMAQDIQLTGKITATEDGSVLPGVSVVVKGTTIGTTSSADGMYSLTVPEDATIVFSFIGMKTKEVVLSGQTTLDIEMEMEVTGLEEVVVTALGISREKKSLGYSMQQIGGEEVSEVRETNFASSLSGKVAGVHIKQANTMGGSVNVIVRGSTSLTGNNQALFVIDGVPVDNSRENSVDAEGYTQEGGYGGYDYGNAASDINPDDIESISVLKGAAATALYGSRAANGVILITTKKGKPRKGIGVTVNSGVMISNIDKSTAPKHQNEYGAGYGPFYDSPSTIPGWDYGWFDYADIDGDGSEDLIVPTYEDASWGAKFDPNLMVIHWDALNPNDPNYGEKRPWVAPENDFLTFFNTGVKYTNNISIDGGNDQGTFRLSYTNVDETGVLPNSSMKRNSLNFSGTYNFSSRLSADANVTYTKSTSIGRYGTGYDGNNVMQSFGQWFETNVDFERLRNYENADGSQRAWNYHYYDDLQPYFFDNPYWVRYKNYSNDGRDRVFGYTKINYKLTDWLRATYRISNDYYHWYQEERVAIGSAITGTTPNYTKYQKSYNELNSELFLSFDKNFSGITLNGLIGGASRTNTVISTRGQTQGGMAVPDFYALSNTVAPAYLLETEELRRTNSILGNVTVGINELVYVDGSFRVDQSSTLPEGDNVYPYGAISTSFILSELDGIKDMSAISFAKFRVNYAVVGSDAPIYSTRRSYIQNANWGALSLFSIPNTAENPELVPERSKSVELGLETSFLNNRVGLDLSAYTSSTFNQILPVTVSEASGYTFNFINGGQIDNKGLEIALRAVPVVYGDFQWSINVNWFANRNEVVELYPGMDNILLGNAWDVSVNARVGEPYGNIEGLDFVYYNGEKAVGEDGYYLRTDTDTTLGNINPDWNAGISNTLTYKGLSFSFLIDIQKGGDIYSVNTKYGRSTGVYAETAGLNELGVEKRTPLSMDPNGGVLMEGVYAEGVTDDEGNDISGQPNTTRVDAYRWGRAYDYNKLPTAQYIFDASYIKLREVSLSYDLPSSIVSKTPLSQIQVALVGRNLWIIKKNTEHFDPEAVVSSGNIQGIESGAYPTLRTIGFNLKLGF